MSSGGVEQLTYEPLGSNSRGAVDDSEDESDGGGVPVY